MSLIYTKKANPVQEVGFSFGSLRAIKFKNPCQFVQSVAEFLDLGLIMFCCVATSWDLPTRYLEAQGYKVIRFWNHDVMNDINGVFRAIELVLAGY